MTFFPLKAAAAAALALFVLSLPAAPSMATDEKPKAAAPKAVISEKRLNDFVAAAKDVYAIRQKYAPKFEAAKDDAEKRQVIQTAQGEMKQAIQNRGMTVEQYNEVLVAAKDNHDLADRIGKMMDNTASEKGS
jgi:chemotaxis regulatin CheY-phosphate phosphatase CheZ